MPGTGTNKSLDRSLRLLLAAFALMGLLVGVCFAAEDKDDDDDDDDKAAMISGGGQGSQRESSGWYVGFGAGLANNGDFVSANDDGSLSGIKRDETDTAFRLFGGYTFNQWVGLEGGYLDLGETSFDAKSSGGPSWSPGRVSTNFEGDGWLLAGVGRLPVSDRWTLFATLGIYSWETTETFEEEGFGTSQDKNSGSDAIYGVGAEYDPGNPDDIVIRGEVGQTKVDDDGDSVNSAMVSGVWKF